MSNMTLDEAIEHCKKVAKEQENCNVNVGCSLEHRQLAIWLSALKAITENNYSTKSKMKKYIGTKVVKAEPMSELDRLKIERYELRERIEKLEDFIEQDFSEAAKKAGSLQAALLVCQRSYMVNYLDVLQARIDLMEQKNNEPSSPW